MFYEELYTLLGKLFYYIAAAEGKVHPAEKEWLQQFIQKNWKPLESSIDTYRTDQANLIDFAFEFEEAEDTSENYFQSFEAFYHENKSKFSPPIISNVLHTAKAIDTIVILIIVLLNAVPGLFHEYLILEYLFTYF